MLLFSGWHNDKVYIFFDKILWRKIMKYTVEPKSIKNFFSNELFSKIKKQVLDKNMGPDGPHFYHTVAGRWLTEIHFDEETEKEVLEIAKKIFNNPNLKRAGFHTARYQMQNGIKPQLWKHYDQSACEYSLDICIEKTVDWQIAVDDIYFDEEENSCVVFSGNDHMHWRPEYPSNDENKYVTLLFLQFANPNHWFFVEGSKNGFDNHGHEADFKFREKMGYWAQPDYSNDRPICSCCDYRGVLNFEQRYQQLKNSV
jgi:hypothetical protein